MADGKFLIGKPLGGTTTVTMTDGASNTNLVLPESGTVASVDTAVTNNAIARYDSTTGKLKNSTIIVDDNGNIGIGVTPVTSYSVMKSIELGDSTTFYGYNGISAKGYGIASNAYRNSPGIYIYKNNGAAALNESYNGSHYWFTAPSGTAGNSITWTTTMILDAIGNLILNPTYSASLMPLISFGNASNTYIQLVARNTSNTDRILDNTLGGASKSAILANGTFQSATNVYGSTSDIKLKENVVDTTPKLGKLMQVKVKNFNYIGQEEKQIGVIAQEIETIFPGVVYETEDEVLTEVTKTRDITLEDGTVATEEYLTEEMTKNGEVTKNVKYSVLYMMMLKGMQEQNEIIKDLKARLEILEGAK